MKLDQIIRLKMIELSSKYEISLVEISKPKEGKIKRTINFNIKPLGAKPKDNVCKHFSNKRELVSWLVCLE